MASIANTIQNIGSDIGNRVNAGAASLSRSVRESIDSGLSSLGRLGNSDTSETEISSGSTQAALDQTITERQSAVGLSRDIAAIKSTASVAAAYAKSVAKKWFMANLFWLVPLIILVVFGIVLALYVSWRVNSIKDNPLGTIQDCGWDVFDPTQCVARPAIDGLQRVTTGFEADTTVR